jgi:hypothetical protein
MLIMKKILTFGAGIISAILSFIFAKHMQVPVYIVGLVTVCSFVFSTYIMGLPQYHTCKRKE